MTLAVSQPVVFNVFMDIWNSFIGVKSSCLRLQMDTNAGAAASFSDALSIAQACVNMNSVVATYQAQGPVWDAFVAYASTAVSGGPTLTDLTNAYNAANTLLTAIGAAYPVDGSGHLLDRTWNSSTGLVWSTATAAQMPTIMSAVTAFLATLS